MVQKILSRLIRRSTSTGKNKTKGLEDMSVQELLALMRHESHRIEKAVYNDILESKIDNFRKKRDKLRRIYDLLEKKGCPPDEPTLIWSKRIHDAFENLSEAFVYKYSFQRLPVDDSVRTQVIEELRMRRSVRVWADDQPDDDTLIDYATRMIDAARWAPNSGNRQAWRFMILIDAEEKALLARIKERHCVTAPLLIFVGMDTRVYSMFGAEERCIYLDAGAAIMQMLVTAQLYGLGACWNHLADDLIESREVNRNMYRQFARQMSIPDYIAPIAVVAVGKPAYLPPIPMRMPLESVILKKPTPGNTGD